MIGRPQLDSTRECGYIGTTPVFPVATGDAHATGVGELAQRRLRESPYFFLKSLSCYFDSGILTLRGQVPYRQLRQFAEDIVLRVDGVQQVVNRVEVFDPVCGLISVPEAHSGV